MLRFVDMHAGGMAARDLCAQLFADFYGGLESQYPRVGDGHTTKSTSPGIDEGFTEAPYNPDKVRASYFIA